MQDNQKRTQAHYIHRLSYSAQEKLAGTFVLTAVAILVWLLITSQKTQNLFEDDFTLYATMSSIQAVDQDTNVIISGLEIGTVSNVDIDDNNEVIITMSILKKYQKLIRTDSVAELLNFKFALIGKSVIEISVGSAHLPEISDGSYIPIKESLNLVNLVAKFEPVLVSIQDSIKKVNEILQAIDPQQVGENIGNLASISSDLVVITAQIKNGQGLAGSAVFNDDLTQDVLTSTANLKEITEQTKTLLEKTAVLLDSVQLQVNELPELTDRVKPLLQKTAVLLDSVQQQLDELPELTDKVKPLLDEADKTIKATQQIWPLSSSMPEDNKQTLTSPEATE